MRGLAATTLCTSATEVGATTVGGVNSTCPDQLRMLSPILGYGSPAAVVPAGCTVGARDSTARSASDERGEQRRDAQALAR